MNLMEKAVQKAVSEGLNNPLYRSMNKVSSPQGNLSKEQLNAIPNSNFNNKPKSLVDKSEDSMEYRNNVISPGVAKIRNFLLGVTSENQSPNALTSLRRLEQESY